MDREQAKYYVKDQLESYLIDKGISTRKPFTCLNPEHEDRHPSMSYDRKRKKVHCFSCGADYDTFDLIQIDYNLTDPIEVFNKGYEIYNLNPEGNTQGQKQDETEQNTQHTHDTQEVQLNNYMLSCKARVKDTDYLKTRGLSDNIIDTYHLGYDPNFTRSTGGKKWEAVIIPTGTDTYTARNTDITADKNDRVRKAGGSPIYNPKALYSGKYTFVTEGEIDALSIIEAGGEAVGLGSTANINSFINLCRSRKPSNLLLLALDNDTEGRKKTTELEEELAKLSIPFTGINISSKYKDPNEALVKGRDKFIEKVQGIYTKTAEEIRLEVTREEYEKQSTIHYIQSFINGIAQSVDTPYIPTGFNNLDNVLEGGLYEGLYTIGAISSLGKTTLILQIADQIAQQGNDVLIFSLEMARTELMAKSISRITFELARDTRNAKTTRGITTGKRYSNYNEAERDIIRTAVKTYGGYANHIYINEGMGDIGVKQVRDITEKHISITGNKPIVIIDYIQLLSPYDVRATDKQNTDKSVLELKRLSRDYKIPIIGISSFNRQSYNQPVSMEAFKESGAIEYSSDILIGLQIRGAGSKDFSIDEAKNKDPREIELRVLKNRNGATGKTINYDYYPLFNLFKEV